METNFIWSVSACFFLVSSFSFVRSFSNPSLLGVHPLDEKYFAPEVIKCKDDSKSFTRDRLNDNFCDCVDGTDEPGTSACPAGKFYCRNIGSTPQFIFSSRVNDRICDCCDGSDENDGSLNCPNTCIMGGNVEYKTDHRFSRVRDRGYVDKKQTENRVSLDDFVQKLKGLKIIIIVQLVIASVFVVCRIFHRHARSKRRHHR
ncbi:putative glucosidase 2 subunit beta, glucosidase II beta subunit [Rosa chinensis]|uniref:Putative glucosidase 2 subunit beta, glucosidase II beta subunit n=1 Tax=Rosa chinensis TaxID=74649 RepID=A0A2P6RUF9_ROSCH|nr:glucosidase 2 subunit beta [Rosa chinensis]PRQ50052.1 putative glucosidase 2 subunit beta, glucosidase II beta subunit [Rosa chinensis]